MPFQPDETPSEEQTAVTPLLATVLIIAALVGAVWSLVLLLLSRPVGLRVLLGALGALELALLAQSVLGVVRLGQPHQHIQAVTFVCYLVGVLLLLPAAAWWSLTERSRWGVGVLLLACLVVPVMIVRLNQLWGGSSV
jgi:hypothetical protein